MERSFVSSLLLWDRDFAAGLRSVMVAPWLDPFMIFISSHWSWIIILVFVLGRALWRRQWRIVAFCLCAALVFGFVDVFCTELLKPNIARLRPCRGFPELFKAVAGCGGLYGFPSNHAANSMVLAVMIRGCLSRSYGSALIVFSLLVGLSRVYLGVHYPIDVMAGWALGALIGSAATILLRRFEIVERLAVHLAQLTRRESGR